MCEVIIQNVEPVSTRESNKRLVKILDSTHAKADLKQAANTSTQLNNEERTKLLRPIGYLEDLFDGTLGDWDIYPFDL